MVEGLANQAFEGWDLTRGRWPERAGRREKQGRDTGGRPALRGAAGPAVPGEEGGVQGDPSARSPALLPASPG